MRRTVDNLLALIKIAKRRVELEEQRLEALELELCAHQANIAGATLEAQERTQPPWAPEEGPWCGNDALGWED